MTEPEFADLLRRFEKGQCTAEERALLEKWLDARAIGQEPFVNEAKRVKVKNALRESVFREAGFLPDPRSRTFPNPRTTRRIGAGPRKILYRIAASVLLIAMAGYGVFRYSETTKAEKYVATETTAGSEILKVHLSDGSIVWLKPHSSLQYPRQFRSSGERRVRLHGEALFEVERKITQPFIVNAGALTATVLGTSFNIKATDETVELAVLTGRVSVTSATDKKGLVIAPDESVVYNSADKLLTKVETPLAETVAEAIIAGTEYNMNFNETRMREVIRRIEGKFNVMVEMSDPAIGDCIITADFTGQPLMKTMGIIAKALAVQYHVENGQVTLTGKGCN